MEAHSAVHRRIVEAGGNSRLSAAHAACDNELNAVLAIVKGDFTAHELATLHRQLVTQLLRGGDEAVRALEKDLQLGGSSAMRRAHADDAATA